MKKRLLIVVDYQNDFVDGALGFEKAKELEPYLVNLIEEYKKNNDDIIYTMDTHQENYLQTEEGKYIPVVHCIRGTKGHELYGKINRLAGGSLIFEKRVFPSSQMCFYLRGCDYTEITLVGVVTHLCVLANAIMAKAALPFAHIIIDAKGCASNDEKLEKEAFDVAKAMLIEVKND